MADLKTRARFGWVKTAERGFHVEDFANAVRHPSDVESLLVLEEMFRAIEGMPDGTPVAATYFDRGVEARQPALVFHKVIFG